MLKATLRLFSVFAVVCTLSATGFAQQGGDGGGGGDVGGGGDAAFEAAVSGASGNTGEGGTEFSTLDADTAFAAIDRGDTVGGNTATVGREDGGGGGAGGGFGGLGGGGGFGGLGGLGGLFGFGQTPAQTTERPIRTRLRSAIKVAPMPTAELQRNAISRFRSLPSTPALRGVNVVVRDRTAILTGVVASDGDRRMSELLMRLEPGIRTVENQVTVSP